MARSYLVVLTLSAALAACGQPAASPPQPSVPRASENKPAGPAIVPFETADWTPLAHVIAIRLHHLRKTDVSGHNGGEPPEQKRSDVDVERIEVFPKQNLIKMNMSESGFAYCTVNGHNTQFSFLFSPGAKVSDKILDCQALGLSQKKVDMGYESRARLSENTLFIDGVSEIRNIWSGDPKKWDPDFIYNTSGKIELHAAFRLTGAGCQIASFARSEGWTTRGAPDYVSVDTTTLDVTPSTTCDLEVEPGKGS